MLADGRRLGQILLGARQAAAVVGRPVGSASAGMAASTPAAFRTPRLPTLDMAARSTLAKRYPRPSQSAVQAAHVRKPCDLPQHTASSFPCNATVRGPIMTIVFTDPVRGRTSAGQSSEDREVVAVPCFGLGLVRRDRSATAKTGTNLGWQGWL